jgi:hypothetical protein
MPRFSRCFAALLLVLLFLPAVLQAAEPRRDAEPLRSGSSAHIDWDVLAQVWSFLTGAQSDNGCRLDPDGRCQAGQSAPATTDNGCRADPNGLCLPGQSAAVTVDNGCWIDPNGRCRD